jgi:hypothetical protein
MYPAKDEITPSVPIHILDPGVKVGWATIVPIVVPVVLPFK